MPRRCSHKTHNENQFENSVANATAFEPLYATQSRAPRAVHIQAVAQNVRVDADQTGQQLSVLPHEPFASQTSSTNFPRSSYKLASRAAALLRTKIRQIQRLARRRAATRLDCLQSPTFPRANHADGVELLAPPARSRCRQNHSCSFDLIIVLSKQCLSFLLATTKWSASHSRDPSGPCGLRPL
jgi:hypothetical protein